MQSSLFSQPSPSFRETWTVSKHYRLFEWIYTDFFTWLRTSPDEGQILTLFWKEVKIWSTKIYSPTEFDKVYSLCSTFPLVNSRKTVFSETSIILSSFISFFFSKELFETLATVFDYRKICFENFFRRVQQGIKNEEAWRWFFQTCHQNKKIMLKKVTKSNLFRLIFQKNSFFLSEHTSFKLENC